MQDAEHIEIESMYAASDAAGAYLERIGKTDLYQMDNRQWMTFIETIIQAFEATRNRMTTEPPF